MLRILLLLLLLFLPALAQPLDDTGTFDGEDADWHKKFHVVPLGQGNVGTLPPDVPADPNPTALPGGGKVFQNSQLYVRFMTGPGGIDWTHTSTRWYFLPTGRTYVLMYDASGNKSEFWGKYQIDPVPNTVAIKTDAGEVVNMTFLHGRRQATWDDTTYTNIIWVETAMQRQNQ